MTHIVAIGGGEIGRPGFPVETTKIDKQIISLTNKSRPNALFLPTASRDSTLYAGIFRQHYGQRLHCETTVLNLYSKPSKKVIEAAINESDLIYVGGGNTLSMMMLWRRLGVDRLLAKAYRGDKIMCGLSAGAICWFRAGLSDSRSFTSKNKTWDYINVHGLNLEDILICPHYDAEPKRQSALQHSLKSSRKIAVALDNCAALEVKDNNFRILRSRREAQAYMAYWQNGKYFVNKIEAETYKPLEMLKHPN